MICVLILLTTGASNPNVRSKVVLLCRHGAAATTDLGSSAVGAQKSAARPVAGPRGPGRRSIGGLGGRGRRTWPAEDERRLLDCGRALAGRADGPWRGIARRGEGVTRAAARHATSSSYRRSCELVVSEVRRAARTLGAVGGSSAARRRSGIAPAGLCTPLSARARVRISDGTSASR